MRTIKFRAFILGAMYDVKAIDFDDEHGITITTSGGFYNIGHGIKDEHGHLMQYTGLKDKNGVEICEGDIVKRYYRSYWNEYDKNTLGFVDSNVDFEGNIIGKVVYYPSKGYVLKPIKFESDIDDETKIPTSGTVTIVQYKSEVIGNIHGGYEIIENEHEGENL